MWAVAMASRLIGTQPGIGRQQGRRHIAPITIVKDNVDRPHFPSQREDEPDPA
jgi:hypothetical protein